MFDFNFCIFQGVIHMLKNLPHANVGSIITGVLCLAVLIGLKHVNERFKNKLKVPIPGELLVVNSHNLFISESFIFKWL